MKIKPIKTEADYDAALKEIERLFRAEVDTPNGDRLEVLVTLVEAYEEKHHKIPVPDPIEAIEYHMERLGLTRKDLEPCIGSRARVADILNRKRPLTLKMIRNLEEKLGIPAAVLVQKYDLSTIRTGAPDKFDDVLFYYFPAEVDFLSNSRVSQSLEQTDFAQDEIVDEESEWVSTKSILAENWPKRDDWLNSSAGQTMSAAH